jgi:hypothetical protein
MQHAAAVSAALFRLFLLMLMVASCPRLPARLRSCGSSPTVRCFHATAWPSAAATYISLKRITDDIIKFIKQTTVIQAEFV